MNNIERASSFRVPRNVKSRHSRTPSQVAFKNLTSNPVLLYWIDYTGRLELYGELNPVNRIDAGFTIVTYVSHPWVAILPGMNTALFNGKKYFFPPDQQLWMHKKNGWMNSKWNLLLKGDSDIEEVDQKNDQERHEVLVTVQNHYQQNDDQQNDDQQIDDQLIYDQQNEEQQNDDQQNEEQQNDDQLIDEQQNDDQQIDDQQIDDQLIYDQQNDDQQNEEQQNDDQQNEEQQNDDQLIDEQQNDDQQNEDQQIDDQQIDNQLIYDQQNDDQQNEEQQNDDQLIDDQQNEEQQIDDQQVDDQQHEEQLIDDQLIDEQQNDNEHFEVLITLPGCDPLKKMALLRCCELFDISLLECLPRSLKVELCMCKQKYFLW